MSGLPGKDIVPASWPKGWLPPIQEQPNRGWRLLLGYLVVSLVAIPALRWIALPNIPLAQEIMAYLLFCLCAFPVVSHFSKREPGLPVFPMICLVYAATYAIPVFFVEPILSAATYTGYVRVLPADTTQAVALCLVGVLSMQIGFAFFKYSVLGLLVPRIRLELEPRKAKKMLTLAGFLGVVLLWLWMTERVRLPGSATAVLILVSRLPSLCAAYLYWLNLHGELKGAWAAGLWLIVIAAVGIGVSMGNVRTAIDPLITIGAVYWMVRRHISWKYAIFGLLFFLAMQSVKGEYRAMVWEQGEARASVLDRLTIWKTLLGLGIHQKMHGHQEGPAVGASMSFSRADMIHIFGHAIHKTPRYVPYQYGKTYSYLLYMWVPRMFWPDKPTAQGANTFFGIAYELQDQGTIGTTSIGLPHIVEAYINFGNLGVIFIMILMGMFYATIDRLFNHHGAGGGGIAIYSCLLLNFVNIETSTAATFGALPQTILVLYLGLRMLRGKHTNLQTV